MFVDNELLLSDSQALTATAVGTNTIDLGVARSMGNGEPVALCIVVEVAADQTTGDEDYTFTVEYSSTADQSAGYVTMGQRIYESGTPGAPAQDADLLVAGYKIVIPIPPTTAGDDARYLGVRYTLAGTSPTITVSAYVAPMDQIDQSVAYADGYSIT